MHWVDRGPEPAGLEAVRTRYTPRWVDYFQGKGSKPSDSHWRDFRGDLCRAFSGDPEHQTGHEAQYRTSLASRTTRLSSITRAWLVEQGY